MSHQDMAHLRLDPTSMERSMSGDSVASQLLDKPSYIATFDANRPRHHRRRSSIPVAQHDSVAESKRGKAVAPAHPQQAIRERRRFRENQKLASGLGRSSSSSSQRGRDLYHGPSSSPAASTSYGHSTASSSTPRNHHKLPSSSLARHQRASSGSSTDTAIYSSTYAAGPSSPESSRGYQANQSSSEDDSSTDEDTFNWDVKHRRSSMPVAHGIRAYLSPHDVSRFERRLPPSADYSSASNDNSIFRRLSPAARPARLDTPPSPRPPLEAPNINTAEANRTICAQDNSDIPGRISPNLRPTPSPRSKEAQLPHTSENTHTHLHTTRRTNHQAHTSPSPKQRRSFNATVELALLIGLGLLACQQLKSRPLEVTRGKLAELFAVITSSLLYFFLTSRPGKIWSTDARSYRSSDDDGAMCGLLLGPLLAASLLITSLDRPGVESTISRSPDGQPLSNPPWLVESPVRILGDINPFRFLEATDSTALALSRSTLLSLQTLLSIIFLSHLIATKYTTRRALKNAQLSRRETSWTRLSSYILFSLGVTAAVLAAREVLQRTGIPIWSAMARWEVVCACIFFQTNMYSISRLGRRSFTLGELAIVAALGVTLMLEAINVTLAKMFPNSTLYLKTFRTASPLLIFQLTLIVGTFLIGFLLSPLLYLSRHLAQKPVHRLRWPHKRDLHRRLLAGFFYLFATAYIFGALGFWVKWVMGGRDPWMWTMHFVVQGHRWWTRPTLIVYWLTWITASIAGWQAVVARAKRFRSRQGAVAQNSVSKGSSNQNGINGSSHSAAASSSKPTSRSLGWDFVNTGSALQSVAASRLSGQSKTDGGSTAVPSGSKGVAGASSSTAAKVKKSTHLSLNARRKFFHALAVILYTPGIALDPAFMHLAFSLAFSIFTFTEYIRYYALYPFGANLHIFLSEFTDHKDSGPVILSHFYLLTGCCGGLWLEGNKQIIHQSGVLILGIGDALASVIGRKYGRCHWPKSSKTIEGSLAFLVSVVFSAWILRLIGWCDYFNLWKYTAVVILLCLMEGVSEQNDNLVLPIVAFITLNLANI
ncbi:unnamed protein product [Sympodiomycopsis kandeliae]